MVFEQTTRICEFPTGFHAFQSKQLRQSALRSFSISLGLATVASVLGVICWQADILPSLHQAFLLMPRLTGEQLVTPGVGLGAGIIISISVAAGLTVGRVGLRKAFPYLAAGYLGLAIVSLLTSRFFAIDTLLFPTTVGTLAATVAVQLARLWRADRELTRLLFQSADKIGSQGTEEANTRLKSGLKLLGTELALNEAIVFELHNELFTPVARLRTANKPGGESSRNLDWRKGIRLCERAAATCEIVLQAVENGSQANVAVPLRHESHMVGALLLRLDSELRQEDHTLLTAVGAQMARNLQRKEFCKSVIGSRPLDYFSATAAETKLEALYVLIGLLTEQRCGVNVLADVSEGVAIAYLDGTLAFVNDELQRFANLSKEKLKTLNIFELLDRFRTGVFDEPAIAVRRVLQSGEAYESELKFPEQNLIFGLRIALVHDLSQGPDSAQPLCLAIYVRDLTRIKEYEQLKSDMISLMSHELRTPLTSINGFAELLCAEENLPETAREFVTIIGNESQRLSRMINTFLAVTQLERKDKQEVLKIPLKLNDVVRETIVSLQPVAKKKRIRLIEQPAHRLPPVAADKSLITQVVKNLVNNAIKYSPERTTVTVSTALEAEAIRVSVEDRGFGIPPESRDRVWEKFYRVVREGQEKDEQSTGLGLAFVREVVEQHGGNVDLESEEGRGSKFSFTLPRL